MKIYGIESEYFSSASYPDLYKYRFYSLFNGTKGAYYTDKQKAIEEGNKHQLIIQHQLAIDFEGME